MVNIQALIDDAKCFETIRGMHWPDGVRCPRCDGAEVTKEQTVTVQYAGCLLDGTSFDSSWSRGTPTSFPLNGVIPGWTNGIAGQKVGSQVLLVVPADQGYGDQENGAIPANSTLVFVVDILGAEAA